MQDIRAGGLDRAQRAGPGAHLKLEGGVVEAREDPVRGAGAILERRVHRGDAESGIHRIMRRQRGREVDDAEVVDRRVEAGGILLGPGAAA